MRAGIFFVAFVVMAVATFADAAALVARWANPLLLYVPAAVLAAALLAHARIPARLTENPAWYVVLALLAAAQLGAAFLPVPHPGLAKLLLVIAVVAVLLRLKPRIGSLYEGSPMPGVLAFLGLTFLLSQSMSIAKDIAGGSITHPAIERIPLPMANLIAAAIVVAIFIMASRIRHRSLQPCPARNWLVAGIVVYVAGAAASHSRVLQEYASYALIVAHGMLFVGATYLLSHLLPRRAATEMA